MRLGFSRKSLAGFPALPRSLVTTQRNAASCQRTLPKMEERPALSSSYHLSRHDANLHSHGWPAPRPSYSFVKVRSRPVGRHSHRRTRPPAQSNATHVTRCYTIRKNRSFVAGAVPLLGRDPPPFFIARMSSPAASIYSPIIRHSRRPGPNHRRSAAIPEIATRRKGQPNDSKGQMGSLVQIRKQHQTRPQCTILHNYA